MVNSDVCAEVVCCDGEGAKLHVREDFFWLWYQFKQRFQRWGFGEVGVIVAWGV